LDAKVGLVLTDPPYPDCFADLYKYDQAMIMELSNINCRQLIFWSKSADLPLDYSAIHIWNKNPSNTGAQYERIFERNGNNHYKVFSYYMVNSSVAAQMTNDVLNEHPSQKPHRLMSKLIADFSNVGSLILDPFLGSGTTCFCAKKLNCYSIGIEIEERYCEIAAKRCCQEVMELI